MEDVRVGQLLRHTHLGVELFKGVAFPENVDMAAMEVQANAFTGQLSTELTPILRSGYSEAEASDEEIQDRVNKIATKAALFSAALTAGELVDQEELRLLTQGALAISLMYSTDEIMDQKDGEAMTLAVKYRYADPSEQPIIPDHLRPVVEARTKILEAMEKVIKGFASEEDYERVLEDYAHRVLLREALLSDLSLDLFVIKTGQETYEQKAIQEETLLRENAQFIGRLAVANAGVQSVIDTLYQVYKRKHPELSSLTDIYELDEINKWMTEANAAARMGDERGDRKVDAGDFPSLGLFSINPFNQPHPELIREYCEQARMDSSQIEAVQSAFGGFSTATTEEERDYFAKQVTNVFYKHIETRTMSLLERFPQHEKFIKIGMRVLIISVVNMEWGEAKLAGVESQPQ